MGDWRNAVDSEYEREFSRCRIRRFNKEKFCKKNRIGHGQYGSHIYVDDHCKFCKKIDPRIKHTNYGDKVNEQFG
jgi:hypothetical protein